VSIVFRARHRFGLVRGGLDASGQTLIQDGPALGERPARDPAGTAARVDYGVGGSREYPAVAHETSPLAVLSHPPLMLEAPPESPGRFPVASLSVPPLTLEHPTCMVDIAAADPARRVTH
jgi:hypothetical protein